MHRKIEETPGREKMLIRLKELRLERGYSMTQAARKIFSHPDTYNRYEKGIREIPLDCLITGNRQNSLQHNIFSFCN